MMKNILMSVLAGALFAGIAVGQQPESSGANSQAAPPAQTPAPPQQQMAPPTSNSSQNAANSANPRVAPGSVLPVTLTKTVDAKKAKNGDEVVAKVTQDLKTNSGEVIVHKDTKVVGRVTEVQPHTKDQKQSEIGIAFDRAVMKNGGEEKLPMSIQAIIAPMNNSSPGAAAGGSDNRAASNAGTGSQGSAGNRGGMSGNNSPQTSPVPAQMPAPPPTDAQSAGHGPITEKTAGVIGIPDLELTTTAPNANQGSLVTSEKNNVKLESGTMLLLRVNE